MTPSRHTPADRVRRLCLADAAAAPVAPVAPAPASPLLRRLPSQSARRRALMASLVDGLSGGEPR
jgi:hypothetical protein